MSVDIYQVDAFTDKAFGGNPAGVVLESEGLNERQMQNIAKEMNLSETVFLSTIDPGNYKVRFFTPSCEVDLCGHGTIATFHTLAELGYISSNGKDKKTLFQETKAGKLAVEITFKNGVIDKVFMEQARPKDYGKVGEITELLLAMGINEADLGIPGYRIDPEIISTGLPDIILPINNKEILDNLQIDKGLLIKVSRKLEVTGVHAFYLPELNSKEVYTRNFAPLVGIDEEAATGTSNGALIYFLKKNKLIDGRKITAYQGESLGRPSQIYCSIEERNGGKIVTVGGRAKIVMKGRICKD